MMKKKTQRNPVKQVIMLLQLCRTSAMTRLNLPKLRLKKRLEQPLSTHPLVQDRPCLIQEQSSPSLGPSIRPPMPVEMEIQPSNAHFVTHPLSAKAPTDIILAKCILPKRISGT